MGRVNSQFGDRLLTDYGLENVIYPWYEIPVSRLWEGEGYYSWVEHVRVKRWVNIDDFTNALQAARQ
jgi:hypothetical protein